MAPTPVATSFCYLQGLRSLRRDGPRGKRLHRRGKGSHLARPPRARVALRGVERIFGVSRGTILRWPEKKGRELTALADTLRPARECDVLELDEAWSFVGKKENKRWLPAALCRRTGQVVAFAIGDRSADTCARSVVEEDPRELPRMPQLLRLLGRLRERVLMADARSGRQKERRNLAYGAFLLMRFASGWRGTCARCSRFRSRSGCTTWSHAGSLASTIGLSPKI